MVRKPLHHIIMEDLHSVKGIKVLGCALDRMYERGDGKFEGHRYVVIKPTNLISSIVGGMPGVYKGISVSTLKRVMGTLNSQENFRSDIESKKLGCNLYIKGDPYLTYYDYNSSNGVFESVSIRLQKYALHVSFTKYNPEEAHVGSSHEPPASA